jgi:hypothetical protein
MILDVWRPRVILNNDKSKINFYEMGDINVMIEDKKKGWVVRYRCDKCLSSDIKTTTSHVLVCNNSKYNTLNYQTCRKCRSRISEYEIKKTFIPYSIVKDSIESSGYKLLTNSDIYSSVNNKSQYKLDVVCLNNHTLKTTWNNWSKGKRCRKCYDTNKFNEAVKYKNGWERYLFLVRFYTEKNYKNYKKIINPENFRRGKKYHLDHKYSIYEGFKNNISPKIIGGVENLEIIPESDNLSKGKKCSITIEELLKLNI